MAVKVSTNVIRVGVDVGQKQDYTAIAVTEEQDRGGLDYYVCRRVMRMPLDTRYADVTQRVVSIVQRLTQRSEAMGWIGDDYRVECLVDSTGVGLPIVEMIREQGVNATAVVLTGTGTMNEKPANSISMGKQYLVTRLAVLLETNRLLLPISEEAGVLVDELQNYHRSINDRGHASYDARRGHDDLVIALGLSVGPAKRQGGCIVSWLPDLADDPDDWRHPEHGSWRASQNTGT